MPELPEVETLCRQLRQVIPGRQIRKIEIRDERLQGFPAAAVTGALVKDVRRDGKTVLLLLDGHRFVRVHLRMSGRLLWRPESSRSDRHVRFAIHLENGILFGIDPRRFATLTFDTGSPKFAAFPLTPSDLPRIIALAARRRRPIKAFLLDQTVVSGIGNIYACEILFDCALDPHRPAGDITAAEWQRLADATKRIMQRAIRSRGTTISDWHDLFGQPGVHQHHLQIYGQKGQPCPRCSAPLARDVIAGRGTYYCPSCQI